MVNRGWVQLGGDITSNGHRRPSVLWILCITASDHAVLPFPLQVPRLMGIPGCAGCDHQWLATLSKTVTWSLSYSQSEVDVNQILCHNKEMCGPRNKERSACCCCCCPCPCSRQVRTHLCSCIWFIIVLSY